MWLPDEDLLGFIRVEAGAFAMGSDPRVEPKAKDHEQPQHTVELPEYYIARYPVTVAQFRVFIDVSGYQVRNRASLRGIPNHRVGSVTFQDALAYGEWLTGRLRQAAWTPPLLRERLGNGWVITLPTGEEWIEAARGSARGGHVEVEELTFKRSPGVVGLHCLSPFGAFDMTSDLEWARSPEAYQGTSGGLWASLRGFSPASTGSFDDAGFLGFRVALSRQM